MTKTIKDYIQFGIDNGYKDFNLIEYYELGYGKNKFITDIINNNIFIKKEFIKAISRGIKNVGNARFLEWNIDNFTHQQAIAIRDNKLEEFINNLLPKN